MTTAQVTISDAQTEFIRRLIESGRYHSLDEIMRVSVNLLEAKFELEERQKANLRDILDRAFASGPSDRSPEEIWKAVEARYLAENG